MLKNLVPLPMLALLSAPAYAAGGHDHGSHSKGDKGFYSHVDVKIHFDRIVDAEKASEEFDEATRTRTWNSECVLTQNFQ